MKLDNDYLYTCGIDDSLRQVDVKSNSYTDLQIKLNAQPRGMDFNSNVLVTATIKEVNISLILSLISLFKKNVCFRFSY